MKTKQAQINTIETVFPESHIIYCIKHIGKNIKKWAEEIYENFKKMLNHEITEEMLLDCFRYYIANNPNTKSANLLQHLLDRLPRWLPSITSTYTHRGNDTSNRVEGFFATNKNLNEHRILPLSELVRSHFIQSERYFVLSQNIKQKMILD